jgi:formylglycine-generating enzyme required for sulfatase activity
VTHFELRDDPGKAALFERDIRTQSYLVRDGAGNYRFVDESMAGYFVGLKLAALLAAEEWTDLPLTDAIVSFTHYLLAQDYRYEVKMEGDMVYVPPGPSIYGSEGEANLRVAMLEKGFWMDRYPVTNEQFCAFLNEKSNRSEGGVEWLDFQSSRIGKKGASLQ